MGEHYKDENDEGKLKVRISFMIILCKVYVKKYRRGVTVLLLPDGSKIHRRPNSLCLTK